MAEIAPSNKELEVQLLCDRDTIPTSPHDTEIHLMCQITAPEDDMVRSPVSICAVIDRSSSMKENMDLMRMTLTFMVDQLRAEDRLALVTFDHDVSIEFELTAMSEGGKEKARKIIEGISERGHTNLSGGLLAGLNIFYQVWLLVHNFIILWDYGYDNFLNFSDLRENGNLNSKFSQLTDIFLFQFLFLFYRVNCRYIKVRSL